MVYGFVDAKGDDDEGEHGQAANANERRHRGPFLHELECEDQTSAHPRKVLGRVMLAHGQHLLDSRRMA